MRWILPLALLCCTFAQTPQPTSQASTLLQNAVTTQFGSNQIQDVQLTGTVTSHFGKPESGTITLEADRTGHSKVILNAGSQSRTEVSSGHSEEPACTWSGPDGKVNAVANHNCWTDGAWFLPLLSLPDATQNTKSTLAIDSTEQNSLPATNLSIARSVPAAAKLPARSAAFLQSLAIQHLYIDSKTALPSALTFNVHPDDDAGKDIPVEIRFSDYRDVNGVKIPFHIEKLMNGSPILEISVQEATFNTGAFATEGGTK